MHPTGTGGRLNCRARQAWAGVLREHWCREIVGYCWGKWGAFSTQFAWHGREGNRWQEFRIPCANAFTGPLPWPVHGARALPSVSCVACWNEQRALGFAEGPLCFGVARGQGRAESRRFSPFTHDPPRSKRMRSIVGVPQAALAPLAHFSGCGPARLRQCRGSPRRSKPVRGLRAR